MRIDTRDFFFCSIVEISKVGPYVEPTTARFGKLSKTKLKNCKSKYI